MNQPQSGLYMGDVVHRRLRPVRHALKYRVFSLMVDIDELPGIDARLRLFSRNRFNLFSLHDSDHGNGEPLPAYLRSVAAQAGFAERVCRFMMLCYPRILGYGFNPLTVYFGLDADGQVQLMIYEVNNTFGARQTYVLPAEPDANGLVAQSCAKSLYVSPFNAVEGTYGFHVTRPGEKLTVGVTLRDGEGPLLLTHFRAERRSLSDAMLLRMLLSTGWMTAKVMAGIHFEAARLWLKGLPLVKRPKGKTHATAYFGKPANN
ncbi:MAG: DUF1365 family protein [Rhizobiaceae bacterium]